METLAERRRLIDRVEHLGDELCRDIVANLPGELPLAQDILEDRLEPRRHHALGHLGLRLCRMLRRGEEQRQQEAVLSRKRAVMRLPASRSS